MGKLFDREEVYARLEDYVRENGDCVSFEFVNSLTMELKGERKMGKLMLNGVRGSIVSVLYDMGYRPTLQGYELIV
tara:strand:+ start:1005 stop:1232 length:228 start_codon:yes stop_codon:yes gene_type:complete